MIQHVVMLNLLAEHDSRELQDVMSGLAALEIEGFKAFQHGPNHDFERKSQDFPYGFICTFADEAALERYANDPDHQALGARLVAMCVGGADGIMVMDLSV